MYSSEIIGQEPLKYQLKKMILLSQAPHCQMFIDSKGFGALPLALYTALGLLHGFTTIEKAEDNGTPSKKLLEHPDLHFVFPVVNKGSSSSKAVSDDYKSTWDDFIIRHPYGSTQDWIRQLEAGNKQGMIGVEEVPYYNNAKSLETFRTHLLTVIEVGFEVSIVTTCEIGKIVKLLDFANR